MIRLLSQCLGVLSIVALCLLLANLVQSLDPLKNICTQDESSVLCYVNCFENVLTLLHNASDVEDAIISQSGRDCNPENGLKAIQRFTGLKRFHYTGFVCPFTTLPVMTHVLDWFFMHPEGNAYVGNKFSIKTASTWNLSLTESFSLNRICCNFIRGVVYSENMVNLALNCPNVDKRVVGEFPNNSFQKADLTFVTPNLESLEFQDRYAAFPVSGVSGLKKLKSLFLIPATKFFAPPPALEIASPDLKSLTEIMFSQEEGSFSRPLKCLELGSRNLNTVTLIYAPISSLACPAIWKCEVCGIQETSVISSHRIPADSNSIDGRPPRANEQVVKITVSSESTTRLNSLLPANTLNTTELIVNFSPLLILDDLALEHFPFLQRLQFGEVWGSYEFNGMVLFSGNPFLGLRNPQNFEFLRIATPKCDCLVYQSLLWLKERSPRFEARILCQDLLKWLQERERDAWLSADDLFVTLGDTCADYAIEESAKSFPLAIHLSSSGEVVKLGIMLCLILYLINFYR